MKASVGFGLFMLFLAGFALVVLRNMGANWENSVPTIDQLAASAWRPSHIGEMAVDDDIELFVQFETDGQLGGNGGCNTFFGSYTLENNKIHVNPIGVTRKACATDIMSIETSFVEGLQLATIIVGAEKRVALRNDRGDPMVRLDAIDRRSQ